MYIFIYMLFSNGKCTQVTSFFAGKKKKNCNFLPFSPMFIKLKHTEYFGEKQFRNPIQKI